MTAPERKHLCGIPRCYLAGALIALVCLAGCAPKPSPTPEPGYSGKCHHWTEARSAVGQDTCIWGIPTSTGTGSWVWLHFSERARPYPDFAADMDDYFGGSVKFTANNMAELYVGRCMEVYGKVVLESNIYNGETVQQPLIHTNSASDIRPCGS